MNIISYINYDNTPINKYKFNNIIDIIKILKYIIPLKKYKTIRTYKNDIKSNIKFIIEMENESIYDFYMLITSDDVTNNENKKIELNNFVKYEALSFLSRLNLYR